MAFIPQTDINDYLENSFNIQIYDFFKTRKILSETNVLYFFNELYDRVYYFENITNYLTAKEYIESDNYFMYALGGGNNVLYLTIYNLIQIIIEKAKTKELTDIQKHILLLYFNKKDDLILNTDVLNDLFDYTNCSQDDFEEMRFPDQLDFTKLNKILPIMKNNESEIFQNVIETQQIKTLKFQGSPLLFTELVKALKESNMLNPELTQKEIFERMSIFFEMETFNFNEKISDIKKRTNTPTPFINTLETALTNFIKKAYKL